MTEKLKGSRVPNLRFKEFGGGWMRKKLGEVAEKINSGKTPLGGEAIYTSEGVIFIRSQNVNNDSLELGNTVFISEETNEKMQNSVVYPNDILLNITGASLGRSCVVPNNFSIGNVNQHVCIIRLNEKCNPRFVQPILSSGKGQNVFQSLQTGSGREGLNFENIKGIQLYFPSLNEQNRISALLSLIAARIHTQNKIVLHYQSLILNLRDKIFNHKVKFEDGHGKKFPEWQTTNLNSIARIFDGTHQTPIYVDKGIPFYSVENVTADNFNDTKFISEDVFQEENKRVALEKGDILMTRIGDIGTVRLIDWDVCASFYVSLALIKPSKGCDSEYLAQYLSTKKFQKELWDRTIHVAFPKKINLGEIGKCIVLIPCIEEQKKIAKFLSSVNKKIEAEKKILEQYENQKKYLMQNMFI